MLRYQQRWKHSNRSYYCFKYGVFVVETKNMKGWIFGTQIKKHGHKKYIGIQVNSNPLHQNYKHVKTLESLLGLEEEQIFSVVVFVGDSTFKTDMPENVTYGNGYIRFIKSKKQLVLSELEVKNIVNTIETGRLTPSFKTNREHVKHVKTIVTKKESNKECPKCGSPMVIRESKRGQKQR